MVNFIFSKVQKLAIAVSVLLVVSYGVHAHEHYEKIVDAQVVTKSKLIQDTQGKRSTFSIRTAQENLEFDLEINSKLLGSTPLPVDEMLVYKGQIVGNPDSWARFTSVNGVMTGAFFDGNTLNLLYEASVITEELDSSIVAQANSAAKGDFTPSVIIDASKIISKGTCGLHDHSEVERFGYIEYINQLSDMTQSSTTIREIAINLIADVEFVDRSANATAEMISHLNVADGIFREQLNIQFVLANTTELTDNGTLNTTDPVDLVVAFRFSDFPNPGLRHLFTGKNLNGSTVGIAYVNSLCRQSSVGVTQRLNASTAIIFAHELGHNFGSPHDGESGSVCSSTSSGFIMFPNINNGGDTFSNCSVSQMLPVIDNASTGSNACVSEVVIGSAPEFLSTPNETATVGEAYAYDSDGQVDLDDSTNATLNLDISPDGMTLENDGTLVWTPELSQVGLNSVQLTASNEFGSNTQFFEVLVEASDGVIDFSQVTIESFNAKQDASGGAALGETNFELILEGNTWKSIAFDYNVQANTVLEFEFYSDLEAEIQGIGFDTDDAVSSDTSFQVFGTQNWGVSAMSYSQAGTYQQIRIPVGNLIQGNFDRLVFILDNDADLEGANARFRNVRVYDEGEIETGDPIDLSVLTFSAHNVNQDVEGTVTLTDSGFGVEIVGNRWQTVTLEGSSITPNTFLSFEFRSTAVGDIHGLGFLPNGAINQSLAFQLLGTQNWGIQDFTYTENGEFQTFIIPVGQYFTQADVEMVFIMDHDVSNPDGVSHFRNISLFEASN